MTRTELLTCLLSNTKKYVEKFPYRNTSHYEVSLLESVLEGEADENCDVKTFSKILPLIESDGYDLSDFFLQNSNELGNYTFMNMDCTKAFDVDYYSSKDYGISYMDKNYDSHECRNIEEAVSLYCIQ